MTFTINQLLHNIVISISITFSATTVLAALFSKAVAKCQFLLFASMLFSDLHISKITMVQ